MTRNKKGRFVKVSKNEKARRLISQGKSVAEVAKSLGMHYSTVFTLKAKADGKLVVRAAVKVENIPAELLAPVCSMPLCTNSNHPECRCTCEGVGHGYDLIGA